MSCGLQKDQRNSELAKIHIAKKDLGMDDATYRDMLFTIARVRSSADLDMTGRRKVLDHLKSLGFRTKRKNNYPGRPRNIDVENRAPLFRKIEAHLAEKKRPWKYVQAMAKRMFHVDHIEFCTPEQLRKIVVALEYDARRHANKEKGNV